MWKTFEKLNGTEQKAVLKQVFLKTGLRYTINTKKSYDILKKEYHTFKSVKMFINEAMQEVLQ